MALLVLRVVPGGGIGQPVAQVAAGRDELLLQREQEAPARDEPVQQREALQQLGLAQAKAPAQRAAVVADRGGGRGHAARRQVVEVDVPAPIRQGEPGGLARVTQAQQRFGRARAADAGVERQVVGCQERALRQGEQHGVAHGTLQKSR